MLRLMKLPKVKLKPKERLDDLIHDDLKVIQSKEHFSFAIDAVLLAYFIDVRAGDKVIDLGTGTGVIPLLITTRNNPAQIVGVEIQTELVDMAQRSIKYNHLEDIIKIEELDIRNLKEEFIAESFDVVVSNPPYLPVGQGKVSPKESIAIARHEVKVELEGIIDISSYLVKFGGEVAYVHRAERLDEILTLMSQHNLQPKNLRLIYPKQDKRCNLILVKGVKGAKPGLVIDKPLIIYQDNGEYTQEVLDIYYGTDNEDKVVD